MKIFIVLLLLLCPPTALSISTTCTTNNNCPNNSLCAGSYCQCNSLYILDCSTQAPYLTSTLQNITLTNITTYFQTQSQQPDVYYSFIFQACPLVPLASYNLSFSLYANSGEMALTDSNFVGSVAYSLTALSEAGTCVDLVQYQIKLESQPNGQTQNLIVGLKIIPLTAADQVANATAIVQMGVTTKEIVSSKFLINIAIGIISASGLIVIGIIIFCCYRRWKARQVQKQNASYKMRMLQDFKKSVPECDAKSITIPAMTTCSICLGQFQPDCKVRKIICKHIFHSECIDSWCMKSLSCPVCRLELTEDSMANKKKQMEMSDYKWKQNTLSDRQHLIS